MPLPRAAATPEGFEEERRLLYVALTRAADWLYVSYPKPRYNYGGGWSLASYQRTVGGLTELIPDALSKRFQRQTAGKWAAIQRVENAMGEVQSPKSTKMNAGGKRLKSEGWGEE